MSIVRNPLDDEWFGLEMEDPEVWSAESPKCGDHIRVCRMNGMYYHHGIYVSDDEVIHFTGDDDDSVLDWSRAHVISTSLEQFLDGGVVEVKVYNDEERADLYHVEGIIAYARACLGDGGYNLFFNNCEHFANACTLGKYRSRQVENLVGGNKNMGLFGGLFGKIGKWLFGNDDDTGERTTNNFNYEPDKVKIAQIESELKLKMADKEKERIELMRDAQIELIKAQALSETIVEQARVKGMVEFAEQIVIIQQKMLDIANARIEIINKCSLPIIKDIENFYAEIEKRVEEYDYNFLEVKYPKLIDMQKKFKEGSAEYVMYGKQIDAYSTRHGKYIESQIEHIKERQRMVLNNFITTEKLILQQTGQITQVIADGYYKKLNSKPLIKDGTQEASLTSSKNKEVEGAPEVLQINEPSPNDV